ncbi:MAG: hypothetical protein LH614_08710, partial [Pyrinomonadaceae bacterium]|nr:hypothetical protein [Pyrinomonadaceae bacterium]
TVESTRNIYSRRKPTLNASGTLALQSKRSGLRRNPNRPKLLEGKIMKSIQTKSFLPKAAIIMIFAALLIPSAIFGQVGTLRVFVTGRELPPVVRAEIRGAKILLPVVPIVRELGYAVSIDQTAGIVRVRRVGIDAEFSRQSSEVRENGVTITSVPFASEVNFALPADNLLLPLEILAPLLNVSIIVDDKKNAVKIESREIGSTTVASDRRRIEVGGLNYNFNSIFYNGTYFQNFNLLSTGRIGSNIYRSNVNFLGGTNARFLSFYGGNFTLQRQSGDEFQIGDLATATASELSLLNAPVRGASYTRPIFGERGKLSLYGGRASGGGNQNFLAPSQIAIRRSAQTIPFDTNLVGGRFSFSPEKLKSNFVSLKNIFFSVGTAWFSGSQHKGMIVDGAARYTSNRFSFQVETAAGNFDSQTPNRPAVKGFGTGIILSGSYTPWRFLTLQARYDRFSPNFANPVRTSQYNNRDSKSFSISVQPLRNLSFGGSYSISEDRNRFSFGGRSLSSRRTESYGLNFAFDPNFSFLPRVSVSATTIKNPFLGSLTFINANFSREFKNFRPYLNYIITSGNGATGHSFNFGTSINAGKFGTFQAQQGFSVDKAFLLRQDLQCQLQVEPCPTIYDPRTRVGNLNGSLDWYPKERLFKFLQFSAGGGYVKETVGTSFQFRTTVGTNLPFKQNFQVSYYQSAYSKELRFSLSGPLTFWKSNKLSGQPISDEALLTESKIRGRVYIDENGNRQYDAGVDNVINNARVSLNNGIEAVSDVNGLYDFERIPPGEHLLAINIEDIRANLVPANGLEQKLVVLPRTIVNTSFRLVKSGSLSGRVWHDTNQNGNYDSGEGLPDIHLVSSSGKDTYTDPDGSFLISELPPGQQSVFIDERYQPLDLMLVKPNIRAEVFSGKETKEIFFVMKTKPREIKDINFGNGNSTNSVTKKDK